MSESRERRFIRTHVEVEGRDEVRIVERPERDSAPWMPDVELQIVGKAHPRVDAREKVTGRARYTTDVVRPGMLHAVFVRAPIARGRITSLDLTGALQMPGVVDALSAETLPRPIRAGGVSLFDLEVRYAAQPVAAVCAESRDAALAAASAVRMTYDAAPPVLTFDAALAPDAPVVRGRSNVMRGSPAVVERGDVDRGLREADVVITREYRTPCVLHTPLEPHAAVAEWEGDRVTVWESTQGIFRVRDEVAGALGIPKSHVRVLMDHMGGGFGAKNNAGAHTFTAAILARRTQRPVRCVLDRHEELSDTGHRPPTRTVVTLGAARDGHLVAIDATCEVALGVGGWDGGPAAIFREMYRCPNVRTRETFAYVNTQAMQAFRAPGHVEGAFALERAMDVLARELRIDRLALRRLNLAARDQARDREYSSNRLAECYAVGAARFGWEEERSGDGSPDVPLRPAADGGAAPATPGRASTAPGHAPASRVRRGVGCAAQVWGAGGGPPAYASVRLAPDGRVDVLSGTQDLGTGARTVLAQIAAESLGAALGDVRIVLGDTERTPYTGNSWGSMTTASVGPAVRTAAEAARDKLLDAAGEILECHPADLVTRDSVITTRDGARQLTFADVMRALGHVMITGEGSRGPNPAGLGLMSFGVQFAEVEVDTWTGVVRVVRIVAVHDVGRVINPLLAQSQLNGGILQGLGYALFEERHLDAATGRPLNTSLHDYKIPTIADLPFIDASCLEGSDPRANHVGARGLAEPPIIPTAPAIANAVADAIGVEVDEIPLTPWRVLAALRG